MSVASHAHASRHDSRGHRDLSLNNDFLEVSVVGANQYKLSSLLRSQNLQPTT